MFTNLLIAGALSLSPFNYVTPIVSTQLDESAMVVLTTVSWLLYQDIIVFTKGNLFRLIFTTQVGDVVITTYAIEKNLIARPFIHNNLSEVYLLLSLGVTYACSSLLNTIDPIGISSHLFIAGLNIAEVLCIKGWSDRFNIPIDLKVPLFVYTF